MLNLAARLVLLPVLAWQAVAVRRRALKLPEPEGARSGVMGDGPALRLLLIGDSSAAGVGVARQDDALSGQLVPLMARMRRVAWVLHAKSGATTRSTLEGMGGLQGPFDVAVVALGVNDITRAVPLPVWMRRQRELVARLRSLGVRRIYLSGIPPLERFPLLPQPLRWTLARQGQAMDAALRTYIVGQPDLTHVTTAVEGPEQMAEDGFHPNGIIYRLWAEAIAEAMRADGVL